MTRNSDSIATPGDLIRSNQAAIERMNRLLDYWMRRDQAQGE